MKRFKKEKRGDPGHLPLSSATNLGYPIDMATEHVKLLQNS